METRYVVKLTNKNLYKEIFISSGNQKFRVGTEQDCDVRLYKEDFFERFVLEFRYMNEKWKITCSDNLYIDPGDVRKLVVYELKHGDSFTVCYKNTDLKVFELEFTIDFGNSVKGYNCQVDLTGLSKLSIGSYQTCDIILGGAYIKNDLLNLRRHEDGWYAEEKETTYGVYFNEIKNREKIRKLKDTDFFSISDHHFYYRTDRLYVDLNENMRMGTMEYTLKADSASVLKYPFFNRNTRIQTILPSAAIEVLDPPARPNKPEENLLVSLIPAFAMLVLTVVVRGFMNTGMGSFIIFSACTMSIGIVTSIVSYFQGKKKYRAEIENREKSYREYIAQKSESVSESRQLEREQLNHLFPDLEKSIGMVDSFSGNLFEKQPQDQDYLCVRLGTGSVKAVRQVNYKNQEKFVSDDELSYMPEELSRRYALLDEAPVVLDLKKCNAIGILGSNDNQTRIARNMILDIAIHHFYDDVNLAFIMSEEQQSDFQWVRFLPHVSCTGNTVRRIACDEDSRTVLFENLYKEFTWRQENVETVEFPHLILFVLNEMKLKSHPLSKFVRNASLINVTFIFFEEFQEKLPQGCDFIIEAGVSKGIIRSTADENVRNEFVYYSVEEEQAAKTALRLAPICCEKVNLEGNLVRNITLFEVLGIYSAEDLNLQKRWTDSQVQQSMAVPVGVRTKNETVYLDIHEKAHGPHGLVAGTTGAGKSELLQSYILSAATLFHPYEVGFVIIDFKGGGMANQFSGLPHMLGTITNIDKNEIERSLLSIRAELLKREMYFARAGVNHIDKYIQKYKDHEAEIPLPHLIIIVDEFAELKAAYPDFMKELISTARIGRSLGVHLILATQKPSGQVNEQIWSNSRFRLCLKVQTPEDSNEMLKSPLAAEIREAGRAYFQVGNNEIFELFQSGYSGAPENSNPDSYAQKSYVISSVSLSGKRECVYQKKKKEEAGHERTQLNALVDYIGQYCENAGIEKLPSICLPPLPAVIQYPDSHVQENGVEKVISIGILDDPEHQEQREATINLTAENTLIIGSSQYGKTNLLQTIIRGIADSYTPEEVNIYIMDFGAMSLKNFEALNHCGGVVCAADDEKFKNLFKMLFACIDERKQKLADLGVSSYTAYCEAGKKDLPQIVLIVDNFTAVRELYLEEEDPLLYVCREGLAVGISVIISNQQTAGMGFRYMSTLARRFALYCNEAGEYSSVIDRCRITPKNVPGRALTEIQKKVYMLQIYLSFDGNREIERVENMREFIGRINTGFKGRKAKRIPEIPVVLTENGFTEEFGMASPVPYTVPFGLYYESIEAFSIDLLSIGVFSIIGRKGSGKSNILKLLLSYLYQNMFREPADIYLLDGMSHELKEYSEWGIVKEYSIDSDDIISFIDQFYTEAQKRYERMIQETINIEEEPLLLLVVQNEMAIQALSKNSAAMKQYKELMGRLKGTKVCFVFMDVANSPVSYNAPEVLKDIKEKKNFFYLDDIKNIKICDISSVTARKYKKKIIAGDGYWLQGNEIEKIKIIKNGGGVL